MKVSVLKSDLAGLSDVYPEDHDGRDTEDMVNHIAKTIEGLGHSATIVKMNLDSFERLRHMKVDVAFNLCDDGFYGESWMEPHVAAMLDVLKIPYTGSNHQALTVCLDKACTKEILVHHGLPTPPFYVAESPNDVNPELDYPVIVKPVREDGSIGIKSDAVVENRDDLQKLIRKTLKTYKQPALVEEYISGREFNVALLGNKDPKVLPVSEIMFKGLPENKRIVSYNAKWLKNSRYYKATPGECPAKIDRKLDDNLREIASKAYRLMGVRGYGRIDFRVNGGCPQILEVNPNPDLSTDAGFFRSAKASGMSYEQLIGGILDYAMEGRE